MVLLGAVNIAAAAVKKEVRKKTGTIILSKTLLASVITLACAVIIFLVIKTVLCKTGTWTDKIC
ncbi:MAG: hypothetical protein AABX69_01385 [Nanoarchaeota archaeon]